MDKNAVALLREDAVTVTVYFTPAPRLSQLPTQAGTVVNNHYVYIAPNAMDLKVGDAVVAPVKPEAADADYIPLKLATVAKVDDRVMIEPGSATVYKWVAAKVDLSEARRQEAHNAAIADALREAYTRNMRRSFAAQVLGVLEPGDAANLQKLLGAPK